MVIKQAVSRTPNKKEWVGRVPDEEGVALCRAKRPANVIEGTAKANLPAIIAKVVVRL